MTLDDWEEIEEPALDEKNEAVSEEPKEETLSITLQAMCGILALSTIKVQEVIRKKLVQIFIDSGSTHGFIDDQLAHKLRLKVDESKIYEVVDSQCRKIEAVRSLQQYDSQMSRLR